LAEALLSQVLKLRILLSGFRGGHSVPGAFFCALLQLWLISQAPFIGADLLRVGLLFDHLPPVR
jgi:hypothetical protein